MKSILYKKDNDAVSKLGEILSEMAFDGGNADTVGGYKPEDLIQISPNLLDNPDFKINQRGQNEYSYDGGERYTVDRWKLQANLTLVMHDDYVTVSRHDTTSNYYTGFRQILNIPDDVLITMQACVRGDGSFTLIYKGLNGTHEKQIQDADGWVVVKCTGYGASEVGVLLRGTATSLDIKWMKIEYGSVATPFAPPIPATELMKCQRYYQRLCGIMRHIGSGIILNEESAMIVCPLPTSMRVTGPTISINGTMYVWTKGHSGDNAFQSTELAAPHGVSNSSAVLPIKINADTSVAGYGATLQFRDSESYIELSADL